MEESRETKEGKVAGAGSRGADLISLLSLYPPLKSPRVTLASSPTRLPVGGGEAKGDKVTCWRVGKEFMLQEEAGVGSQANQSRVWPFPRVPPQQMGLDFFVSSLRPPQGQMSPRGRRHGSRGRTGPQLSPQPDGPQGRQRWRSYWEGVG